eukprot:scaffold414_cov109-Cylindrotheca_fusiformis.AAC.3
MPSDRTSGTGYFQCRNDFPPVVSDSILRVQIAFLRRWTWSSPLALHGLDGSRACGLLDFAIDYQSRVVSLGPYFEDRAKKRANEKVFQEVDRYGSAARTATTLLNAMCYCVDDPLCNIQNLRHSNDLEDMRPLCLKKQGLENLATTRTNNAKKVVTKNAVPPNMTWDDIEKDIDEQAKWLCKKKKTIRKPGGSSSIDSHVLEMTQFMRERELASF